MDDRSGQRFENWQPRSQQSPDNINEIVDVIQKTRSFVPVEQLDYGDHGLAAVEAKVLGAIQSGKSIALYADYDVDGTMSCVSWLWFFAAIGYKQASHYIPCRFTEGYGLNLEAIKHLIHERGAQMIITMDTGITANEEAEYCRAHGVDFICTDHHKIQPEKMPDCTILNPKQHPDAEYQELCGCGITFVLLRRLGRHFQVPASVWQDILALTGMATICDVVPLNPVNHRLAKLGVKALMGSQRSVLLKLKQAVCAQDHQPIDELDVGFKLGPRINAVGRLEHADAIIRAFTEENADELITYMGRLNDQRKALQDKIIKEATAAAEKAGDASLLFLGGDWHPGVVGIAASRLAEEFWRPVFLFNNSESIAKGSARSIPGFDVTSAMVSAGELFNKFGGHSAAGGFSFDLANEGKIRAALTEFAENEKLNNPQMFVSRVDYDCDLPIRLLDLGLVKALDNLRPFGMDFPEPLFAVSGAIENIQLLNDKKTGAVKHSVLRLQDTIGNSVRIMFFNQKVELQQGSQLRCLVSINKNYFRGQRQLSVICRDWQLLN